MKASFKNNGFDTHNILLSAKNESDYELVVKTASLLQNMIEYKVISFMTRKGVSMALGCISQAVKVQDMRKAYNEAKIEAERLLGIN